MIINPKKNTINFEVLKQKSKTAVPDKEKKEIPGLNDTYSVENFVEFKVLTKNNQSIKLQTYLEHGKNISDVKWPKALVVQAHGLFASQNSQGKIPKLFSEHGITTVGFDFRGHGKSEGLGGFIENSNYLVNDLIEFLGLVDNIYDKSIPRFFLGLSFGGTIGFLTGLRIPEYFKGMLLMAPGLQPNQTNKLAMKFARFCSCLISTVPMPNRQKNEACRNPASFEKWTNDPLVYRGGIRLKTIGSVLDGFDTCKRNFNKFIVPFIVVIGGMDKLVDVEACVDLYEEAPCKDKTLLFAPNMWHVVPHEEEFEEIFKFIMNWINEKIGIEKKFK